VLAGGGGSGDPEHVPELTAEQAAMYPEVRCSLARFLHRQPGPQDVAAIAGGAKGVVFGGHVTEQVVREAAERPNDITPGVPTVIVRCVEVRCAHPIETTSSLSCWLVRSGALWWGTWRCCLHGGRCLLCLLLG